MPSQRSSHELREKLLGLATLMGHVAGSAHLNRVLQPFRTQGYARAWQKGYASGSKEKPQ